MVADAVAPALGIVLRMDVLGRDAPCLYAVMKLGPEGLLIAATLTATALASDGT